jgi:hypothetical protein
MASESAAPCKKVQDACQSAVREALSDALSSHPVEVPECTV